MSGESEGEKLSGHIQINLPQFDAFRRNDPPGTTGGLEIWAFAFQLIPSRHW